MNRKFFLLITAILLGLTHGAEAQQPTKVPRIGFLSSTSASAILSRVEAFRQGLHELGYVEGKNIVIEWRYADGNLERLPDLAAELVRLKVDVIVTGGPAPTRSAKQATATIPIVMGFDDDPVGSGFVASLAHPGGNITGLSTLALEISGKQLELLKEIVSRLSRVNVLGNASQPGHPQALKGINHIADALDVHIQYVEIREPKDIDIAFRTGNKERAEAVLVLTTPRPYFSTKTGDRPRGTGPTPGNIR